MSNQQILPPIIQGGMGIAISDWRLARAVSGLGQLGVVSGTALDSVLVRRLQDGDPGGEVRRAMEHFPIPAVAAAVLKRYFRPEGRSGEPYRLLPMYRLAVDRAREQVTMLANFVEVFLAREGHQGPVGINLLTKIQFPTLASLYGAMLAGVDCVLMGAGIPREIPAALDALALHQPAAIRLEVEGQGSGSGPVHVRLDPREHWAAVPPPLHRPRFLPIVASNSLATMFARKASGRVDGFIIEGPTAGGHNAPPRGEPRFNDRGEPVYGERDEVDLARVAELGLPFWLAGGAGRPGALQRARDAGAAGIQVGTLFAYSEESGLREDLKRSVLEHAVRSQVDVFTSAIASPTGYPFKLVRWPGDPDADAEATRTRVCDLGYLRTAYTTPEGGVRYRCASEPVESYLKKGGLREETTGRRCLCNALLANIGQAQVRTDGAIEPSLLTSGDDLVMLNQFLGGRTRYSAAEAIAWLLAPSPAEVPASA